MKPKSIIKIVVDVAMLGLFIPLMIPRWTGLIFHEVMGLFIVVLFIAHVALNWKWVVGALKRTRDKIKGSKTPVKVLSGGAAILMAIGIVYYSIATALEGRVSPSAAVPPPTTSFVVPGSTTQPSEITTTTSIGATTTQTMTTATTEKGETSSPEPEPTEETITAADEPDPPEETPTLADFLGRIICTLCPRYCPLSHPQCRRANNLIREATVEFQVLYGAQH